MNAEEYLKKANVNMRKKLTRPELKQHLINFGEQVQEDVLQAVIGLNKTMRDNPEMAQKVKEETEKEQKEKDN
jgi:hypothetical protein